MRVAGCPGRSGQNVSLDKDRVAVEMSIRRGVFIGEDSRADAKMLTVVGGNFIDITSVGSKPMKGDMGKDSTSVPYSPDEPSRWYNRNWKIDVTPLLHNMLVEVHDGFDRHPGALRRNLRDPRVDGEEHQCPPG